MMRTPEQIEAWKKCFEASPNNPLDRSGSTATGTWFGLTAYGERREHYRTLVEEASND